VLYHTRRCKPPLVPSLGAPLTFLNLGAFLVPPFASILVAVFKVLWRTQASAFIMSLTPQRSSLQTLGRNSTEANMPARKLTDEEVNKLLSRMPGWRAVNGKLHKTYECKDFNAAFGNMTRVALIAEAMNHHPEWANVWNRVSFDLVTHSVKGISDLDFVLAEKIEEIFSTQAASRATTGT
jgi:4a-hydroxytetrahydrobiopterin dehydratase